MKHPGARGAIAEAIGTFSLVLAGCGAIVVEQQTGALGHVGVAIAFGLVIVVMVLATGHVSGAHLNPAVTLAFLSIRRITPRTAVAYLGAQLAGASVAAFALALLFPTAVSEGLGATMPSGAAEQSLGIELLLTAMLMFVIVSVATDARAVGEMAAVAIGGTVLLGAMWAGPISGASMNPARSLGPALAAGAWTHHWLYWLGPIVGAVMGAWAYELLREKPSGA